MVESGKAKSRNEFVAQALRRELALLKRAEIDAEFAHMADDAEYLAEAQAIANRSRIRLDDLIASALRLKIVFRHKT